MSVRNGMMALLAEHPRHCYGLKADFEDRTGNTWAVNIGQVYSTLERLERDGLVAATPGGTERGNGRTFELTAAGRSQLEQWYAEPVLRDAPPRDELAIKLLLAVGAPDVDAVGLIQRQRTALVGVLQRYTRQKELLDEVTDLPSMLLHDALILDVEAQLRWLDLCEARLARRRSLAADTDHGEATT